MFTGLISSNLPIENSQSTKSANTPTQSFVNAETASQLIYNNPIVPKESIFAQISDFFLGPDFLAQEKWQKKSLPPLQEEQLNKINKALAAERKIVINDIEIKFTLNQLFKDLLSKNDPQSTAYIEHIELAGGAVTWVLANYLPSFLKDFGVEKPNEWLSNEWLSDEVLKEYTQLPKDFDFRIFAPKATIKDIETLKKCVLEFLINNGIKQNPSLEIIELRKLLLQYGFTNYTKPKNLDQDFFSTIGFGDIDLIIYQNLSRKSLFLSDSLFLPLTDILKNDKLINQQIIPYSNFKNGCDAIFDRLSGIIRAIDPQTINCAGWPRMLINYLKGKRCLTSDLETTLLNKTICTLKGSYAATDCPKELFKALRKLEMASESKRRACVIAFWLQKSLTSHLHDNPSAALILTLQACVSLKINKYDEVIPQLWSAMKPSIKGAEDHPFLTLIIEAMDHGAGSFEFLFSLLQVKAFLFLNSGENNPDFKARLIMHQRSPAIQIKIGKFNLLLPYTPSKALLDLKEQWESIPAFEKLDLFLQPQNPYVKQQYIPDLEPFLWGVKVDFSKPCDRIAAEWFLASELQHPSTNGSKLIEDFLPDLLSHMDKKSSERILQSALNASSSLEKSRLFNNIRRACSGKAYASIPIPLIVAISLAAVGDPVSAYKAYNLWKKNCNLIPGGGVGFTTTFLQHLGNSRPDLALNVLCHLLEESPSFQTNTINLNNILNSKNKHYITRNNLLLLAKAAKKIIPADIALIQKIISELVYFKRECLEEIKDLWWLIYNETSDIESLKKLFEGNEELLQTLMDNELLYNKTENCLSLLTSFESTKAIQWKKLFDQINLSKNKELCQKAWDFFQTFLENPQNLKGTSHEKAEAFLSAIKTMANKNPNALYDLLGKEQLLIAFYASSQEMLLHKTAKILFNTLLDTSELFCSNEKLKKLLTLRQVFAGACQAPLNHSLDWKIMDQLLTEKLAHSTCISLKMEGLKTYIEQNNYDESIKIILFLLKNDLPKNEALVFVQDLLSFLFVLPNEKYELVLKILQTPQIGEILKQVPSKSFYILLDCLEKTKSLNGVSNKFTTACLKYLFELLPSVNADKLVAWSPEIIRAMEHILQHPLQSTEVVDKVNDTLAFLLSVWPAAASIKKVTFVLNELLEKPSLLITEMGSLLSLELLSHPQNTDIVKQENDILGFLTKFLKIAERNNYLFTSRFFDRTTRYPLPKHLIEDCLHFSTIHDLISLNWTYVLSIRGTLKYKNAINQAIDMVNKYLPFFQETQKICLDYVKTACYCIEKSMDDNSSNERPDRKALIKMICSYLPIIAEDEESYESCLKTAFVHLEMILNEDESSFQTCYNLIKGIKPNIKTRSIFIQKLLSFKFNNLDSFDTLDMVLREEFISLLNTIDIDEGSISQNLRDYVFWTHDFNEKMINTFYSIYPDWRTDHETGIFDILNLIIEKELYSSFPQEMFQYCCLAMPCSKPPSLNLNADQINQSFTSLISHVKRPTLLGIYSLTKLATEPCSNYALKVDIVSNCWLAAIDVAFTEEQLSIILNKYCNAKYFVDDDRSSEWEQMGTLICNKLIIKLHCFSNTPTTENVVYVTKLLELVWKRSRVKDLKMYYQSIDQLILKLNHSPNINLGYIIKINKDVISLIMAPCRDPRYTQDSIVPQAKAMSKWISYLATLNRNFAREILQKAINDKVYETFSDELNRLFSLVNEGPRV